MVLVPEIGLRTLEARSRMVWIAGSLAFLAARAYISVATAKKHNTNINRKLGVTSREELMLYIDLFRRCGRLDEIAVRLCTLSTTQSYFAVSAGFLRRKRSIFGPDALYYQHS